MAHQHPDLWRRDGRMSEQAMLETVACPLCGGGESRLVMQLDFDDVPVRGTILRCCRGCGMLYVSPRLSPEALLSIYSQEYFETYYVGEEEVKRPLFRKLLARIERWQPPGRILDVGCGIGTFLEEARKRGWKTVGVEPSSHAGRLAHERSGSPVHEGTLAEAAFPSGSFDVICFWDSLEHTPQPVQLLKMARDLLVPNGLLVLKVPNTASPIIKVTFWYSRFKRLDFMHALTHMMYFTPETVRRMVVLSGFAPLEIRKIRDPVRWRFRSPVKGSLFRPFMFVCGVLRQGDAIFAIACRDHPSGRERTTAVGR